MAAMNLLTAMNLLAGSSPTSSVGIPDAAAKLIVIISSLIYVVAEIFVFIKVGEAWWKALIPIYGQFLLFRIAGKPFLYWIEFIFTIPCVAFSAYSYSTPALLLPALLCAVVLIVAQVRFCLALSRSFGHETAFSVGLLLLPHIFLFVLAFDGSVYLGDYIPGAAVRIAKSKGFYEEPEDVPFYYDTETSDASENADGTGNSEDARADGGTCAADDTDGGTCAADDTDKPDEHGGSDPE